MDHWFKTEKYEGAWIPFDGDRTRFRFSVEEFLRAALNDSSGKMWVDERGPHWKGNVELAGLSYSQTTGWGLVVFSRDYEIGVDVEREKRTLRENYLKIAARFFHPREQAFLASVPVWDGPVAFFDLWMKKEAHSKLLRMHLVKILKDEIPNEVSLEVPFKMKTGYRGWVAWRAKTWSSLQ